MKIRNRNVSKLVRFDCLKPDECFQLKTGEVGVKLIGGGMNAFIFEPVECRYIQPEVEAFKVNLEILVEHQIQ